MQTDYLLIGLSVLMLILNVRMIRSTIGYKNEDKKLKLNPDNGTFLLKPDQWFYNLVKIGVYSTLIWITGDSLPLLMRIGLMFLLSLSSIVALIYNNKEVMTIKNSRIDFRFGDSISLNDIIYVDFRKGMIFLKAKSGTRDTNIFEEKVLGDWSALKTAVIEFVSKNESIEIRNLHSQDKPIGFETKIGQPITWFSR